MTHTSEEPMQDDLWHVEVGPGDVRVLTLEQLDLAFEQGLVSEASRVWQEGMASALPLGELLGDGDAESPGAAEPPPVVQPAASASHESMWPPPIETRVALPAQLPLPPRSAVPSAAAQAPKLVLVESASWPPAVTSSARPSSVAQSSFNAAPSVAPMAFDLSDEPSPFAAPRRRGRVLVAASALMAVALGAAFFSSTQAETVAAAATAPPAAPEPPKSHAYDPGSEPIHLRETPPPAPITTREAPPAAAAPAKAARAPHKPSRAASTSSRSRARGSSGPIGFKGTGKGSKYDPLNGAL
jgi:hypothetical protein